MLEGRSHRRRVRSALALGLVVLVTGACRQASPPADEPAEAGRPDFRLATLDGDSLGPTDYRGRVVILDFWATWCVPCRFQTQVLAELYPELQEEGTEILGVNLGEPAERIRDHLEDDPQPWPVLLDSEDRLTAELGIEALPALMILDRSGAISYFGSGLLDTEAVLREVARASGS